jgi:hypothetical protein
MRRQLPILLAFALSSGSCGTAHTPYRGGSDGDADTDSDSDTDTRPDGDAPPWCGDERGPLEIPPERIVNGDDAWDPSVVALTEGQALAVGALLTHHITPDWQNVCTATLIAPRVVLTAAHCVVDFWEGRDLDPSEVRFAVGPDAADPLAILEPTGLNRHPEYDLWSGDAAHDVAVLILPEPAATTVPGITPIEANCEALHGGYLGQRIQNVGYGSTERGGGGSNTRRWWTVEEVVEISDIDFVVDGHGISGVCFGDSGGPSLWTMPDGDVRVAGTVSWGDESCVDLDHFARTDDNCDLWDDVTDPCGGETLTGRCDGTTAIWCEGDEVVRQDCFDWGLECGDDDRGRMRCVAPIDSCNGETFAGRCSAGAAVWCDDGEVIREECEAWGLECSDNGAGLTRCVEPSDPCGGETFEGRCAGTTAVWCDDGRVRRELCSEERLVCGPDDEGLIRCLDDPCRGFTWEGRCVGGSAVWCEEGQIHVRICADCGESCGWSEAHEGYYCR